MEQTLTEFRRAVRGPQTPKQQVRNSWGVYDYYKYYRKTKPKEKQYILTESQYFSIIRRINQKLVEQLLNAEPVELPMFMGTLEAFRKPFTTKLKNGKGVTTKPIDWDKTLKLWYEDPESYKRKSLIYVDDEDRVVIVYDISKARYANKTFYQFRAVKAVRESLQQLRKTTGFTAMPYFISTKDRQNIRGLYNG